MSVQRSQVLVGRHLRYNPEPAFPARLYIAYFMTTICD
jgi:hypothetical protein